MLSMVVTMSAQIPYFAGTVGDHKLYAYTSVKFNHGDPKNLETYTTFNYGIGNHFATGVDLYTYGSSAYIGYTIRGNFYSHKYFSIGGQFTPSFDLGNQHKFSYATTGLYMNGSIYENLFWCSNTWWGVTRENIHSLNEWLYLGYTADFKDKGSITPMVGYILKTEPATPIVSHDLSVGFYYTYKCCNFYLWTDKLIVGKPRVVIGVDFTLPTKNS